MHARSSARTHARARARLVPTRTLAAKVRSEYQVTRRDSQDSREGGAGSLNNAPIMHADKRVVCCVSPFSLLSSLLPGLAAPWHHTHKYARVDARQRTRARKYIPRRVSDTRHARFPSSRERNDTLSTYICVLSPDSPPSPNFYWPTPREFYRGDIFPNKYDFVRGEKNS